MPAASVFIDSNVALYGRDHLTGPKTVRASEWLWRLADSDRGRLNLQVLNEVTNVMLRKRMDLSVRQIFAAVDGLRLFGTAPITERTVEGARALRLSTRYSWWDCLLLASALELGCTHFLSEDLQDGQRIALSADRSLTLVDPFAHSPDDILTQH